MVATRFLLLSLPLALAVPSVTFTDPTTFDSITFEPAWYRSHPSLSTLKQRLTDSVRSLWPSNQPQSAEKKSHATQRSSADQLVLRFNVSTDHDIKTICDAADTLFLDIWDQSEAWLDIRLSKDDVSILLGLLPFSLRTSHTALLPVDQLARAVQGTYPSSTSPSFEPSYRQRATSHTDRTTRRPNSDVFFDEYRSLSVIGPWMRLLQSLFSSHVRTLTVGKSFEGRDIPALRVGVHSTNDASPSRRKTILVTGGLHAREWVSTSTVNYIAYNLITSYGRRRATTRLLEEFDFIFIPTVNPDGYEYTWTTDRLWRKNRQPTALRFCHGLDLDRTYPFKWDGNMTSSSDNPCSEGYAGSEPMEATETRTLMDWARNETEQNDVEFIGLLDLHSYSQQILYPYSYSCDAAPPNYEDLAEMASGLAKAIRTRDHENYRTLSACGADVTLSTRRAGTAAGGSLLDWFYHELKVHHAFQVKLRDKGSYGFLLPKEEIVPTGMEMMQAVEYFGRQLGAKYGVAGIAEAFEEEEAMFTKAEDGMFAARQKSMRSA